MKEHITKEIKETLKEMEKTNNIYTLCNLNKYLQILIEKYLKERKQNEFR